MNTIPAKEAAPCAYGAPRRVRRRALGAAAVLVTLAACGWALLGWFTALQNRNVSSGIRIGERAPDFSLPDQNGRVHSLRDLSGPNGLLLVFVRSADW